MTPISIHALLAESDHFPSSHLVRNSKFLSTLSLRRATAPSPPRQKFYKISIHALLAESDTVVDNVVFVPGKFLSTLSLRRATGTVVKLQCIPGNFYPRSPCGERLVMDTLILANAVLFLSTLSLRRATSQQPDGTTNTTYFYPRSPCGERHRYGRPIDVQFVFLSTLSLRRATWFFTRIA